MPHRGSVVAAKHSTGYENEMAKRSVYWKPMLKLDPLFLRLFGKVKHSVNLVWGQQTLDISIYIGAILWQESSLLYFQLISRGYLLIRSVNHLHPRYLR